MSRRRLADTHVTTLASPTGDGPVGTVYVIHFECPFGHAKHYTGWALDVEGRLWHHRKGTGAWLMKLVGDAGIDWHVSRLYQNATKQDERRLKVRGGASRLCPTCAAQRLGRPMTLPLPFEPTRKGAAA